MSNQNGSMKSPAKAAASSVAGLAHDAVALVELQTELLKVEFHKSLRDLVKPVVLLIVAASVTLGCVPVLLLCLAQFLVEIAGLTQSLSLFIAALVGLTGAGAAAFAGLRRLKNSSWKLERSKEELSRNIHWIKQVLKHRSNPPRSGVK